MCVCVCVCVSVSVSDRVSVFFWCLLSCCCCWRGLSIIRYFSLLTWIIRNPLFSLLTWIIHPYSADIHPSLGTWISTPSCWRGLPVPLPCWCGLLVFLTVDDMACPCFSRVMMWTARVLPRRWWHGLPAFLAGDRHVTYSCVHATKIPLSFQKLPEAQELTTIYRHAGNYWRLAVFWCEHPKDRVIFMPPTHSLSSI